VFIMFLHLSKTNGANFQSATFRFPPRGDTLIESNSE
jgi:hypothetical protein